MKTLITTCGMLGILCAIMLCVGCSNQSYYDKLNVSGEHVVARTSTVNQINGEIFGSFFIGCGAVTGKVKGEEVIGFTWSPKPNQFVLSTVSKSKVVVIIDSTKQEPTIEFIVNAGWLREYMGSKRRFEIIKNNINELFESEVIDVVKVRISRSQLKQEVCLPQP